MAHVTDGMTLGLGTGRAAEAFIRVLGERVQLASRVRGVPTSNLLGRARAPARHRGSSRWRT